MKGRRRKQEESEEEEQEERGEEVFEEKVNHPIDRLAVKI